VTLPEQLAAFIARNRLSKWDRELIERAIDELREFEEDESRHDAHEKAEFEKAFPGVKKYKRKRNI